MERGLCTYTDLVAGTKLDLCDVAIMNDLLDIADENRARVEEYYRSGG